MPTFRAPHLPVRRTTGVAAAVAVAAVLGACASDAAAPFDPASAVASPSVGDAPSAPTAPSGPPTVGLAELEHLELELAGGPDWPAFLRGSIWILAPDGPLQGGEVGPLVYRLDAATGAEEARIPIGGRLCQGIAAGFGSIWACTDTGLARIDPATNEVAAEIEFEAAQVFARPVMTEDRVWMIAGNVTGNQLVEIDPASNEVVGTQGLEHAAAGLTAGDGALWATVPADDLLLRIDPATGASTVHAEGLPAPVTIAHGAGSLWIGLYGEHGGEVAAAGEPAIARVSPADGSVEAEIAIGTTTMVEGDIWASDDVVWVRSPADPFLVRIDPATNEVVSGVAGFHSGGSLTVVDGVIWTTSIEFGTAWRIEP